MIKGLRKGGNGQYKRSYNFYFHCSGTSQLHFSNANCYYWKIIKNKK